MSKTEGLHCWRSISGGSRCLEFPVRVVSYALKGNMDTKVKI
jgi:hypothetical protein